TGKAARRVEIEIIRRAARRHAGATHVGPHDELVLAAELGRYLEAVRARLPNDLRERPLVGRDAVVVRVRLVVGDVEIEGPVAVDGGERDGGRALPRGIQPHVAPLREPALAVVYENRVRPAGRGEHEIEVAVAIDVGERDTGRMAITCSDAGRLGNVLESPPAAVAIQRAAAFRAGEEHVHEAVA